MRTRPRSCGQIWQRAAAGGRRTFRDGSGGFFFRNENGIGSAFGDRPTGDSGNNLLEGGAGADVLNGGGGDDTASYSHAAARVIASLTNAAVNTGDAA